MYMYFQVPNRRLYKSPLRYSGKPVNRKNSATLNRASQKAKMRVVNIEEQENNVSLSIPWAEYRTPENQTVGLPCDDAGYGAGRGGLMVGSVAGGMFVKQEPPQEGETEARRETVTPSGTPIKNLPFSPSQVCAGTSNSSVVFL